MHFTQPTTRCSFDPITIKGEKMFDKTKNPSPKPKIDFIQSFGKLELKDGDIIVLKSPKALGRKDITNLKIFFETFLKKLPVKIKTIVLEDGLDIGILRPEISGDTQERP
jgi:hypothetical protein